MASNIVLPCIIVQALIALYLFNTLKLKDDFEKKLNVILVILIFHLAIKFFILAVLRNHFLYNNNATGFGLSYGPLLYIMARTYVRHPMSIRSALLHMLPFLLLTFIYFIHGVGYLLHVTPGTFAALYADFYQILMAASLVIYPLMTIKLLHRFISGKTGWKEYKVNLLLSMSYVMMSGVTAGVVVALIHILTTGNTDFDLRLIPYLSLAVLPVLILRYKMKSVTSKPVALQQPFEITNHEPERHYKKSAVDVQMMDQYEITLKRFMEKTKIYLEAEISLEALSAKVKIPKHHLTQLLNERFKKNFYVFINEYRINEAIKKLEDPKAEENILSLAYDCGFNSKSSFNNYFKKITGVTPTMYRKKLEETFSNSEVSS